MRHFVKNFPFFALFIATIIGLSACNKNNGDEPRRPEDITGIWSPSDSVYLEFGEDYSLHHLDIEYQDGESIGIWTNDAYIYEPGYHIVILLKGVQVEVYQVVDLTDERLTWCWVKEIVIDETVNKETIGKLLGNIIKEAQEGFKLDPELYESFKKISEDDFFSILEDLDIMYPW